MAKTEKPKKAPGFFKKKLKNNHLQKKYLKYLEQKDDIAFIKSIYTADGDFFNLRPEFNKKEFARLKTLAKAIKTNRKGAVNLLPLAVLGGIAAAAIIFFGIFANPLLRRATERGLETVFEARVDAENFRVSLIDFEIYMSSLTIADRDRPMRNLIQFDTMRVKLKPQAVLRGRVYIEEIRADNIRFGTPRTVSGALPARRQRQAPERPAREPRERQPIPMLVDLRQFDPMALLEQEFSRLQTPALYGEALEAYNAATARWSAEEQAARARVEELQERAEPLLRINVNDFTTLTPETIAEIRTTIDNINAMTASVQAVQSDFNRLVAGVQDDINSARALEQNARNAFAADLNQLRSYLDLGSGVALELLEGIIKDILADSIGEYLAMGERALEIFETVRALQAQIPEPPPRRERGERFTGRNVIFPTRQYPRFFLGTLAASVLTPAAWQWAFDLQGVSSDPNLSGVPATLALSLAETGDGLQRSGAFNGLVDLRSDARERFGAEFLGAGFPVDISAGLRQIGVDSFGGDASFSLNLTGHAGGGFNAGGAISFVEARLTNPANTFSQAAEEAIRHVASVDLGIRYEHRTTGRDHFSVTTNFGDIMMDALARIVAQYRRQAEEALERALRAKVDELLAGLAISRDDLDRVFAVFQDRSGAVNELRAGLDRQRAELENRIRSAADDALRQVEEAAREAVRQAEEAARQAAEEARIQAEEAARQAAQDLLQGQTPQAPQVPGLPALPGTPSIPGLRR